MQSSLLNHPTVLKAKQRIKLTANRLADQHVSLAVTGLSGSGKTAFITSLVNQLIEANECAHLPFFSILNEHRLIGVKRDIQPNLVFNRFAYEAGIEKLSGSPAQWPDSTRGVSQVRLKIKYRSASGVGQYIMDDRTLTLDITDYPGEWLLDLPLLKMDFGQWLNQCNSELTTPARQPYIDAFMKRVAEIDFASQADELILEEMARIYADYLKTCQTQGYKLIQPGRFVLPAELADAPILQFFPIPLSVLDNQQLDINNPPTGSYLEILNTRFNAYKEKVVKPFYQEHFKRFDRQVILVDCLSALNNGYDKFKDLQKSIDWLMGSFQYGSSNILNRLFKPKIDKLVFAASKADHVTPDQQANLVKLLESMLHEGRKQIQFEGVKTETTVIAAIRSSQSGITQVDEEEVPVLKGTGLDGQAVTLFPGDVPKTCPAADFWKKQSFAFPKFSPPNLAGKHELPHIRLDQVLEFLLADKLA